MVFNNLAENSYFPAPSAGFLSDKKTCKAALHSVDDAASFADLASEAGLGGLDAPCAVLGNIGNPPTPPLINEDRASGKIRFALLRTAGRVLHAHGVKNSIKTCGNARPDIEAGFDLEADKVRPRMPVSVSTDGTRLRYSGMQNCGSARCPRCAPVRGIQLSERVGLVLNAARAKGFHVQFVTLTAHHTIQTCLSDMRDVLGDVYRRCWDGKGMARLKREGLLGGVRVWETTDGTKTGWHLHAHVLVISETAENCEEAAQHLKGRWVDLLAKRGWKSSLKVQDSRPVTEGFQRLGAYGAEDLKGWGIAAEMAGEWIKTGKRPDRLSVPELLALAHAGDGWAARRYAEAVDALSGLRLFVLGPKLKRALGLDQVHDLNETDDCPDLVPDDWRDLGCVDGEVWGGLGSNRRPAAALLIWRHGVIRRESWKHVLHRLNNLARCEEVKSSHLEPFWEQKRKTCGKDISMSNNADYLTAPLSSDKPYLGNYAVVHGLLQDYLTENFRLIEQADSGAIGHDESYELALKETDRVARIFCGLDPDFEPVGVWNGVPLADAILKVVDASVFHGADLSNPVQVVENFLGFLLGQFSHSSSGAEIVARATRLLLTGVA